MTETERKLIDEIERHKRMRLERDQLCADVARLTTERDEARRVVLAAIGACIIPNSSWAEKWKD